MRWLLLLLCVALVGCGGGGGSPAASAPSAPAAPVVRSVPLEFGYFGIDGDQLAKTAQSVSYVLAMDWGDWNLPNYDAFRTSTTITQLQEAKARGVPHAWVAIGYLIFTQAPGGCVTGVCLTPRPDAIPRLLAFRTQLEAVGLLDMVKLLYPADEPELYGLTDAKLAPLLAQVKAAWPGIALGVIYSDHNDFPGIHEYDKIGRDKYGDGAGVLNELPPISGAQQYLLVPGGASGLSSHGPDDPQPFYDYAMAHPNVYAIVAFLWANSGSIVGIGKNGMLPKYTAIGCLVTKRCPP